MAEFHKAAEAADPFEAIAVRIPTPPGYDGMREMARCFIEEYALMGWPRDRIARLFEQPRYAGAHAIYEERGEAFIRALIDDVLGHQHREEANHA